MSDLNVFTLKYLYRPKVGGRTATGTPTRHATAGAQAVSVTGHTTQLSLTRHGASQSHRRDTLVTAPRHVPSSFALLLNDW